MKALRVIRIPFLLFVTLVGCRIDETVIGVTPGSQGVTFEFRYIVQADQPVKVSRILVQDQKSGVIVWEITAVAPGETNIPVILDGIATKDRDGREPYERVTLIALSSLPFGNVPTGFKQVTPADQAEVQLHHGLRYRVIALAERGSEMTEFTLKGECQKFPFTTFTKDLPEFKESKDC